MCVDWDRDPRGYRTGLMPRKVYSVLGPMIDWAIPFFPPPYGRSWNSSQIFPLRPLWFRLAESSSAAWPAMFAATRRWHTMCLLLSEGKPSVELICNRWPSLCYESYMYLDKWGISLSLLHTCADFLWKINMWKTLLPQNFPKTYFISLDAACHILHCYHIFRTF